MSLLRYEGLAHFTSGADWGAKGHTIAGVNYSFAATGGRGNRGKFTAGLNAYALLTLPSSAVTVFHHFACYTSWRTNAQIALFRNASQDNILIRVLGDGSIEVSRCATVFGVIPFLIAGLTTLGTSNPAVFRNSTWHQLQIKCKISATVGEVTIYVDGVSVLSLTGINTYNGVGGVYTTQIGFSSNDGVSDVQYSDIAVCDDAGAIYNTYLGDVACYESVAPTDGDLLQWVRSTGAGTWSSHVDDNPQNGDTDYVSSAVSNDRVSFLFPAIAASIGTPLAVKETVCHRKEDASLGLLKLFSRSSDDVNHDGSNIACSESYKFDERIYEKDLKDNSTWTTAKVNATDLGILNAS